MKMVVSVLDNWVLVSLDTDEETLQPWRNRQCDDRDSDSRKRQPKQESVPLPYPELPGKCEGMGAGSVEQTSCREGNGSDMKEDRSDVDERDNEEKLKGINKVIGQLGGRDVQPQKKGSGEAKDGGASQNWVNANQQADSDAPGQLLWRCPHAQKRKDGKSDTTVEPVVMGRHLTGFMAGGVDVALIHF